MNVSAEVQTRTKRVISLCERCKWFGLGFKLKDSPTTGEVELKALSPMRKRKAKRKFEGGGKKKERRSGKASSQKGFCADWPV